MAKVLITGGAGFIGRHCAREFLDAGWEVRLFDCVPIEEEDPLVKSGCSVQNGDVRDEQAVELAMEDCDAIVHLAAVVSVPQSMEDPDGTMDINVRGTRNILNASQRLNLSHVIIASSAAVYGDSDAIPIPESAPLIPQSPYAVSKIVGEELLRRSQIQTCALRFFNVYGPNQTGSGGYAAVIPAFKNAVESGNQCTVFGDGTQVRDFIHVSDLVRIIGLAIETDELPSELNVASGEGTTLLQLIEILADSNKDMQEPVFEEERPGDIHTSLADISLLKSTLDIGDMIGISEGLL